VHYTFVASLPVAESKPAVGFAIANIAVVNTPLSLLATDSAPTADEPVGFPLFLAQVTLLQLFGEHSRYLRPTSSVQTSFQLWQFLV